GPDGCMPWPSRAAAGGCPNTSKSWRRPAQLLRRLVTYWPADTPGQGGPQRMIRTYPMSHARQTASQACLRHEGQRSREGRAAWALENLRGGWKVTPAVVGTTQLDAVHRVVGRPGVVLVAEGAPHRLKPLLAQEKKRVSRLVGDTPIYDVTVGNGEGQVPLAK